MSNPITLSKYTVCHPTNAISGGNDEEQRDFGGTLSIQWLGGSDPELEGSIFPTNIPYETESRLELRIEFPNHPLGRFR